MAETEFEKPEFELTGGVLCLDFANTSPDHKVDRDRDKIQTYADLLAFAVQTGELPPADARKLLQAANDSGAKAEAALRNGRDLREIIYRVFSNCAAGRKPSREHIEELNSYLGEALRHARVVANNGGFARAWEDAVSLERPLWPIVSTAVDLLTGAELNHVRECNSERCSWLFVDRSRNGTRRWCDMKVCGNRAKARRHYARVKS